MKNHRVLIFSVGLIFTALILLPKKSFAQESLDDQKSMALLKEYGISGKYLSAEDGASIDQMIRSSQPGQRTLFPAILLNPIEKQAARTDLTFDLSQYRVSQSGNDSAREAAFNRDL